MKTLLPIALLAVFVVSGCQSGRQQANWTPPQFDPPQAGKVQIALYGDVKASGKQWVAAPATLGSIEKLVGDSDPPPWHLHIVRSYGSNHLSNFMFPISTMSQKEKGSVSLQHGDMLEYFTDQPVMSGTNAVYLTH